MSPAGEWEGEDEGMTEDNRGRHEREEGKEPEKLSLEDTVALHFSFTRSFLFPPFQSESHWWDWRGEPAGPGVSAV